MVAYEPTEEIIERFGLNGPFSGGTALRAYEADRKLPRLDALEALKRAELQLVRGIACLDRAEQAAAVANALEALERLAGATPSFASTAIAAVDETKAALIAHVVGGDGRATTFKRCEECRGRVPSDGTYCAICGGAGVVGGHPQPANTQAIDKLRRLCDRLEISLRVDRQQERAASPTALAGLLMRIRTIELNEPATREEYAQIATALLRRDRMTGMRWAELLEFVRSAPISSV